ncbi:hypothetical protein L7F22_044406 [Adiantum nelumboides]|nr:hypothetical protein [Adiantum nelumboides]
MELSSSFRSEQAPWWPALLPFMASLPSLSCLQLSLLLSGAVMLWACTIMMHWAALGGTAWGRAGQNCGRKYYYIPGPRGWPVFGSLLEMGGQAHVRLAKLASSCSARTLMAFSLGDTRVILTCVPEVAKEILCSSSFADRPIKSSAHDLLFHRAIGFAPHGAYWRNLRRLAATCLFAPRRIAEHEPQRQEETTRMLQAMGAAMARDGVVPVRMYLQRAAVNNIMGTVFGRTYEFGAGCEEGEKLQAMVREGFELLGAVNWQDHLTWLQFLGFLDRKRISCRCAALVKEVRTFVQRIIDDHRLSGKSHGGDQSDFVDVLLSLEDSEKLADDDMIAVLWEMIFRGTDTTAILTEWVLAELTLHPEMQERLQAELDAVAGPNGAVEETQLSQLPYLQAVIKETLRLHPPGPLLSWARLATEEVHVAGHVVPAGTTAMVNMWAITHDEGIWKRAGEFWPDRFLEESVDIRGSDLRLAPFGAGRRVCPGRALGYATVQLWVARLLLNFQWASHASNPISLADDLKLSCEMKSPLLACPSARFSSAPLSLAKHH